MAQEGDTTESLMQFLYRAPIGLLQARIDGAVEMLNPMSAQLLMPIAPDGALDNLYRALDAVVPELPQLVAAHADEVGVVCDGLRFETPDAGRDAPQVLALSVMKLDAARLMATLTDVTLEARRERQLDRRLREAARTDALTQMPNRDALRERVGEALGRRGAAFALLFLNADRFQRVNDRLGQAGGDRLLVSMADRLRAALRAHDRPLAARVGGDEFAVLLDDLDRTDEAHAVAERLLDVLAEPYAIDGTTVHASASLGIVMAVGADAAGDAAADALLHDAGLAMAEAKRGGGNGYAVFEAAMRERAARRSGIEADLRHGIEAGQLFVVYQPVVGLADGVDPQAGVEALVRWRHPERGVVPPLDFIPVAEECGLIAGVGGFVLRTVCADFMRWQRELGPLAPRSVAVNLSRAQLAGDGVAATLRDAFAATGMAPARLQLEVTESLAAQDDQVQQQLHALKALGVTLALDDFGTGYSSLASLHLLPVDTLKIDRSFVARSDESAHRRVLIEATVRVAKSLGMATVAEGIETAAEAGVVRDLGCDKGQGYFFARPMPTADLERWLRGGAAAVEPRTTSAGSSTAVV